MRFNLLLLLLTIFTTLTAVALSQKWKPCQVNIKLKDTNFFWTLDIRNNVILNTKPQSLSLTTVPFGPVIPGRLKGSSINRFHGESIQSNGHNKGITLSSTSCKNLTQCWHFRGEYIHPCNDLRFTWALTAELEPSSKHIAVKLKRTERTGITSKRQKWVVNYV